MSTNRTIPSDIYIVTVENRLDGIYAFNTEAEAERFIRVLLDTESEAILTQVPLNLTPDHTDNLIQAERDSLDV
jgi:hypothetical protein